MKNYFEDDILESVLSEKQKERAKKREPLKEQKRREAENKKVAAENRKQRRKFFGITMLALIAIALLFGSRVVKLLSLVQERKEAQAKLDTLNRQVEELQDELSRVTSDEYIEQQARSQLRMIYPGEVLYVVLDTQEDK